MYCLFNLNGRCRHPADLKGSRLNSKLKLLPEEKPWYSEGLRFECTGCGQCCTGAPGYIWVSDAEIEAMTAHLNLPLDKFKRRFLRKVGRRYSLVEYAKTYDCIFLKDNKCSIYPVRPTQCRTFPWWAENLSSPEAWADAATRCEGIQKKAPLIDQETIDSELNRQNAYVASLDQNH